MTPRQRRIIGRTGLVLFVIVYIVAAMIVGAEFLADRNPVLQIAYFAVAGFAWVLPGMWIIRWSRGGEA